MVASPAPFPLGYRWRSPIESSCSFGDVVAILRHQSITMFGKKQATEDRSNVTYHYANVASISSTDAEVIITFATARVDGDTSEPQSTGCRIYMNYFTGKRFSAALQMAIELHTKAFGPIAPKHKANSNHVPSRSVYANYLRLAGNPEELVFDFGMNPDAAPAGSGRPHIVHSQIVMQYTTAKQLADDISRVISDYERRQGNIELSIPNRRV
jgi:hypothetical protein